MAFDSSSSNVASVDMSFLGQALAVAEKVFVMGKIEICIFAATIVLSLIARLYHRDQTAAKKQLPRRASPRSLPSAPKPPQVNAVAQLADDSILMRSSTGNVLSRYAGLKADQRLSSIDQELASSPHTTLAFYQSLVQCACRGGQPELVESLLDDMEAIGCNRTLELYESAMRLLAAKKRFKEALSVNDRLSRDGLTPSLVTQSCLVSFSAELGLDDKTVYFFERLCEAGPPSVRACMVVLRVHAKRVDWPASVQHLRAMWEKGVEIDSLCLNIVLATGVAAGKMDEAEALLSDTSAARIADTISYNTVLKGLAQKGVVDKALTLFNAMPKRGVHANLITFNTMIDAATRARKTDDAWRIYTQLRQSAEFKPDKCTCSTLVKALGYKPTSEQIEDVLNLVDDVVIGCAPDLVGRLLSGILYAALRIADLKLALRTKAKIVEQGYSLSEADARSIAQLQARSR